MLTKITVGDDVFKQVKDSMWSGKILGSFTLLDGTLAVAVQGDKLFLSDPSSLYPIEEAKDKFVRF